ncbi:MAG: hypothetical protein ACYC5O_24545 [Anaerolineae bacterium]
MRYRMRLLTVVFVLAAVLVLAGGVAAAQSGGPYDLSWNCAGCSGGAAGGGTYVLFGSVGQPAAGTVMIGGSYAMVGGFLAYGGDASVYLPMTMGGG